MKLRMLAMLGALSIAAPLVATSPNAEAGLFKSIKKGLQKLGKKAKKAVKGVVNKVKRGARSVVSKARKTVKTVVNRVKRGARSVVSRAKRAIKQGTSRAKRLLGKVKKGAKRVLDRIKGQVKNVWTQIKRGAGKAIQRLKAMGKDLLARAKKMGQKAAAAALTPVFLAYIEANRKYYQRQAKPLTAGEKSFLAAYYPQRLIDGMRVLELPTSTGFFNKSAGATTYAKNFVIIRQGHRSNSILKHEMLHACQYEKHGQRGFAAQYAKQYVDGGFSYRKIKFEEQAYEFQAKGSGPVSKFLGYCN